MCEEEFRKSLVTVELPRCLPAHSPHWQHPDEPKLPFSLEETDALLFAEMSDLCMKYATNMLTLTLPHANKDNAVLMQTTSA